MIERAVKSTRRLVRHRRLGTYFRDGGWTGNLEEARSFSTIEEVAETCRRHQLKEVELVLRFDAGIPELAFPIN
jgi:hypothetical protein